METGMSYNKEIRKMRRAGVTITETRIRKKTKQLSKEMPNTKKRRWKIERKWLRRSW